MSADAGKGDGFNRRTGRHGESGSPGSRSALFGSLESLRVALEVRDAFSRHHCDRVAMLATELGRACEIPQTELDYLRVGASFHDIGKIGIPDAVLLKPASLTAVEWALMKTHSEYGERIFEATYLPDNSIAAPIRHHHENFDGSGYPDGLRGEAIPLLSRILLIADNYDAIGTARPYHPARSHREVMDILTSENERKIDPQLFREFARLIERSPARMH